MVDEALCKVKNAMRSDGTVEDRHELTSRTNYLSHGCAQEKVASFVKKTGFPGKFLKEKKCQKR